VGGLEPAAHEVREAAKTLRGRMGAREGAARA
jgi:hypothetical protein